MFRGCLSIVGLVLLISGGVLLFMALGPQQKKTVEVGGKTTTQEEVAAQTQEITGGEFTEEIPPELPVTVDGMDSTTNSVGVPQIEREVLSDMTSVQSAEQVEAPVTESREVVITEDVDIATVPLETSSAAMITDVSGQGGGISGSSYEQRVVELEYPRYFRVKGSANIRLTLRALPSGEIVAIPEIPDNAIIATPILLTDLHDTHNAYFSVRLDAPSMKQVRLLTNEIQMAGRGEDVTWRWTVQSPDKSQTATLLFIVDMRWEPKSGVSGATSVFQRTIWSQPVQVDVNYVFGNVAVPQASIAGTALAVVGLVAEVPTGTAILTWLLTRRRNPRRRSSTSRSRSSRR